MLRVLLAAAAAILLVTVLSALIVESRSVKEGYYAAHAARVRAVETSRDDINAVIQGTQNAFQDGRPVANITDHAFSRLLKNNTLLQAAEDGLASNPAVVAELAEFNTAVAGFVRDGQNFAARQSEFAEALRTMQEESPLVVKELRNYNLRLQSQNTFSLAIDLIEFATGASRQSADQLSARIEALNKDRAVQAAAPGVSDAFTAAAEKVIEQRSSAQDALRSINSSQILETLWRLSNEIMDANRRTVRRAEMAGLLLAVCTVLLLLGGGYAMFRLQASYRELNSSNRKLASSNDSLEERVADRTRELSSAYEELKESQVQLVQAEKMSSLGGLVAGISHEINTPLWYLISNSTVLQERLQQLSEFCDIGENMLAGVKAGGNVKEVVTHGLTDMQKMLKDGLRDDIDEAKDLIKDSIAGLEELTELAQSLKDFSRLDRARQGEFNVHDGLDKTLLIAKNRIKNKVTVHKHYGDLPPIHCSPSQINQIFLNLLTNAADAIEDSGDVVIRTLVDNGKVRISFADTGSGIPKELIDKIRDPFFTTKDVGKGTGLGLSIVDQIVNSHGGELLIESEQGRGTTVTIVLPIVATPIEEETNDTLAANDSEIDESSEDEAPEAATV